MAELTPADVQTYTHGRLLATDPTVIAMLAAALRAARRETKWHVSPVRVAVTMTLDGPNSRVLFLPTMKVDGKPEVVEDGTLLDPDVISVSAGDGPDIRRRIALRKSGAAWWSAEYGAIEVTMDHGFDEDEAADWRQAILSMVDQMSLLPITASGASAFGVKSERIDDVAYTYDSYAAMAADVVFSIGHILEGYRLPDLEFM